MDLKVKMNVSYDVTIQKHINDDREIYFSQEEFEDYVNGYFIKDKDNLRDFLIDFLNDNDYDGFDGDIDWMSYEIDFQITDDILEELKYLINKENNESSILS